MNDSLFGTGTPGSSLDGNTNNFTVATEFNPTADVTLQAIKWYSISGAAVLPTWCGIFKVSDQSILVQNASPSWSGGAGSGWVRQTFDGSTVLSAGVNYRVGVFGGGAAWMSFTGGYWSIDGPGSAGITSPGGLLFAPSAAAADGGLQTGLHGGSGSPGYPTGSFINANYFVDLEVSAASAPARSGLLMTSII